MNRTALQQRASDIDLDLVITVEKLKRFSNIAPILEPALSSAIDKMCAARTLVRELMHPDDRAGT